MAPPRGRRCGTSLAVTRDNRARFAHCGTATSHPNGREAPRLPARLYPHPPTPSIQGPYAWNMACSGTWYERRQRSWGSGDGGEHGEVEQEGWLVGKRANRKRKAEGQVARGVARLAGTPHQGEWAMLGAALPPHATANRPMDSSAPLDPIEPASIPPRPPRRLPSGILIGLIVALSLALALAPSRQN